MTQITLTINSQEIEVPEGTTILQAARKAGFYIPVLCAHPDLPQTGQTKPADFIYQGDQKIINQRPNEPAQGCGICLVEVEGDPDLTPSCATEVQQGMVVQTENPRIKEERQKNLSRILANHPHACLTCPQQDGCSRTQCPLNVPENERCCELFGQCELQRVANYVGIAEDTPKWVPSNLPILESPLIISNYNLCIGCTRCVRVCRDIKGIEAIGFVYDSQGKIHIGTVAPSLEESGCKFCTACVHVCPTGAIQDRLSPRLQKKEDIVPCQAACPAQIDIPEYLRLISVGKNDQACAVIREKVPFPGTLGRICPHPCEDVCRRGEINEPISICALKRYAADQEQGFWKQNQRIKKETGRKVAIVGAGPAGMTTAFYLRKQGHKVKVFESASKAGGMMRYGIPAFRLPVEVLDKEIEEIFDLGIEFVPNHSLGQDISLDQLKSDGFDAILLAVGAQMSRNLPLLGSNHSDVLQGIEFLKQVSSGKDIDIKDRILVIGGGNVAVDAALTALRCGAKEVTMACLEELNEMPANQWEIARAIEEGIQIRPSWGPKRILFDNGQIRGLELQKCSTVFDKQRRFSPRFSENTVTVKADQIIFGIGQTTDLSFLENDQRIKVQGDLIAVNEDTLETGMNSVYAVGDAANIDNGNVILAIASGKKAARAIDKSIGGDGKFEETLFERQKPYQYLGQNKKFVFWSREVIPTIKVNQRHSGFQEMALGFFEDQAKREARRCLQCDLRLFLDQNPSPPELLEAFTKERIEQVPETEGVYQLYDQDKKVMIIKGCDNLRKGLLEDLKGGSNAIWFYFEENKMFSQRENELIQQYLQRHGQMPGIGDPDLDDLF